MNVPLEKRRGLFDSLGEMVLRGRVTCPCCGYPTLTRRAAFEACPLCGWVDDGQDDPRASAVWEGPNQGLSLAESRRNFERRLACLPPPRGVAGEAESAELCEARRALIAAYDGLPGAPRPDGLAAIWADVEARETVVRELAARQTAGAPPSAGRGSPPGVVLIAPALPLTLMVLSAAAAAVTPLAWVVLTLSLVAGMAAGVGTLGLVIVLRAHGTLSLRHPATVAGVLLSCMDILIPAAVGLLGYKIWSGLRGGSIIGL